jgi:diguanylate cyclase (GGDEF)-like protein
LTAINKRHDGKGSNGCGCDSKSRRRPLLVTKRTLPSIRARLVLLVVACIVPGALFVLALIMHDYGQRRTQIEQESIETARAMVAALDRDLASARAAQRALATSSELQNNDLEAFQRQAVAVQRSQPILNVVLIDREYRQRVNTLRPFGAELPLETNPAVRRAFDSGEPFTTDAFIGRVAQEWLVGVGVPVLRGAEVRYVLAAGIAPATLSKLLSGQRLSPERIGVIIDGAGTIVARTHDAQRFVGQKAAAPILARMKVRDEDALETTTVEGVEALVVFSKSAISNWTVGLGIPLRTLTAPLLATLEWLIAGTLLLLAFSIAVAWALANRIASSINALVAPAQALGRGAAVVVGRLPIREANDVGRALVDASRRLHDAQYRASHDALTGLANRTLFNEILASQIALCERQRTALAVAFIDLDGFKGVNDNHGHAAGDDVLRTAALRIKGAIRDSDVASRLGGDEFAVLLVNVDARSAVVVCSKLVETLSAPYTVKSTQAIVTASIGIASYPEAGRTVAALSRRADAAMYRSKHAGKKRYAVAEGEDDVERPSDRGGKRLPASPEHLRRPRQSLPEAPSGDERKP